MKKILAWMLSASLVFPPAVFAAAPVVVSCAECNSGAKNAPSAQPQRIVLAGRQSEVSKEEFQSLADSVNRLAGAFEKCEACKVKKPQQKAIKKKATTATKAKKVAAPVVVANKEVNRPRIEIIGPAVFTPPVVLPQQVQQQQYQQQQVQTQAPEQEEKFFNTTLGQAIAIFVPTVLSIWAIRSVNNKKVVVQQPLQQGNITSTGNVGTVTIPTTNAGGGTTTTTTTGSPWVITPTNGLN